MMLYFITGNVNKFKEIVEVFREEGVKLQVKRLTVNKIEIQSKDISSIAKYAAIDLSKKIKKPFFIEDAGLFIEQLKGFPGPYSHYVYDTIGVQGILKLLENVENRKAIFVSAIALVVYDEIYMFEGKTKGSISDEPRGSKGFGFDPIFIPKGSERTFAEMDLKEKNKFSHRAKAARKMIKFILKHI